MTEIIFQLDEDLHQSYNQDLKHDDRDYDLNYQYNHYNYTTDYFNVYNGIDTIDLPSEAPELSSSLDSLDSIIRFDSRPSINLLESDKIAGCNYNKWLKI